MVYRVTSFPFWVMAAWTAVLAWLLLDDRFHLFIAPKFFFLIVSGLVLALIFTLSRLDL